MTRATDGAASAQVAPLPSRGWKPRPGPPASSRGGLPSACGRRLPVRSWPPRCVCVLVCSGARPPRRTSQPPTRSRPAVPGRGLRTRTWGVVLITCLWPAPAALPSFNGNRSSRHVATAGGGVQASGAVGVGPGSGAPAEAGAPPRCLAHSSVCDALRISLPSTPGPQGVGRSSFSSLVSLSTVHTFQKVPPPAWLWETLCGTPGVTLHRPAPWRAGLCGHLAASPHESGCRGGVLEAHFCAHLPVGPVSWLVTWHEAVLLLRSPTQLSTCRCSATGRPTGSPRGPCCSPRSSARPASSSPPWTAWRPSSPCECGGGAGRRPGRQQHAGPCSQGWPFLGTGEGGGRGPGGHTWDSAQGRGPPQDGRGAVSRWGRPSG